MPYQGFPNADMDLFDNVATFFNVRYTGASIAFNIGGILGGTITVETVYSWPGLGYLAYQALQSTRQRFRGSA